MLCKKATSASTVPLDDNNSQTNLCYHTLLAHNSVIQVGNSEQHLWFLDSGAMAHMTCQHKLMHHYMDIHPHKVSLGDNHILLAIGRSLIYSTQLLDDSTFINITLKDILYMPGLVKNLVSMAVITDTGYKVVIMQHHCTVQHPCTCSVCLVTTCSGQMLCV
jgi:hypothetical protein